jgi:hypothetical protein
MKTSKARKIAGFRRSAEIIIIDIPQKFQINLTTGEWKKHIGVAVPLSIA